MSDLKKNKPCPHCGRYNNRAITVDAVVIKDNRVLLIKRGVEPMKDYWATPGGHVEWGETLEAAAVRELKEETNLTPNSIKLSGAYSFPERHPDQTISIAYLIESDGDIKEGGDSTNVNWFELSELPENLAFDHRKIIKDAISLKKS